MIHLIAPSTINSLKNSNSIEKPQCFDRMISFGSQETPTSPRWNGAASDLDLSWQSETGRSSEVILLRWTNWQVCSMHGLTECITRIQQFRSNIMQKHVTNSMQYCLKRLGNVLRGKSNSVDSVLPKETRHYPAEMPAADVFSTSGHDPPLTANTSRIANATPATPITCAKIGPFNTIQAIEKELSACNLFFSQWFHSIFTNGWSFEIPGIKRAPREIGKFVISYWTNP